MYKIDERLKLCESIFNKNKTSRLAILLADRYYLNFYIKKDKQYLDKALNLIETTFSDMPSDFNIYIYYTILNIELDNLEKAKELLNKLNSSKSYLKNNDFQSYVKYLFALIMLEIKKENKRLVNKYIKMLGEYTEKKEDKFIYLLFGIIEIKLGRFHTAYKYLKTSYQMESKSVYLFIMIHKYFSENFMEQNKELDVSVVMFPYVVWAMEKEIDLSNAFEIYKEFFIENINTNIEIYKKIFHKYKFDWTLKIICNKLVEQKNYSLESYKYYKVLENRQLLNFNYIQFLVRSAFLNDINDLTSYSIDIFLQFKNIEDNLKGFLYYILVTDKKMEQLTKKYYNDIIQFTLHAIENKVINRYLLNIYYYFFKLPNDKERYALYIDFVENNLSEELFKYEIHTKSDLIKYIWINEKEKKEIQVIDIKDKNAIIDINSKEFDYFCIDETGKIVIDENIKIVKVLENVDIKTCKYFMEKGVKNLSLFIYLAKYSIKQKKPTEDCMQVISTTLKYKEISQSFRMELNATLGNILNSQSKYEKALEYYKTVDDTYLNDRFIEQMLTVFLNTKEYKKAVNLILKKSHLISDRNLFYAIKKICTDSTYHEYLGDICYELLLKSWYDKKILDIVIKHYNGSQEDWHELTKVLIGMSINEIALDEIIIKNCIWMHKYDIPSQKVFARMYTHYTDNKYIEQFVYYSIYVILIEKTLPEYETIEILENIYNEKKDKYLAYALSTIYLEKSITTPFCGKIINETNNYMVQDGILLSAFKNSKDKSIITPYIEKNQSFIYRTFPDKKVFLNYQLEPEGEFFIKEMKYVKFGLYMTTIIHFFSEKIKYFYSEEMSSGSIESKICFVENNKANIIENSDDIFFTLNNALVYEKMFKFEKVEKIIWEQLRKPYDIKGKLL